MRIRIRNTAINRSFQNASKVSVSVTFKKIPRTNQRGVAQLFKLLQILRAHAGGGLPPHLRDKGVQHLLTQGEKSMQGIGSRDKITTSS
jgi:hypothetical protein